MKNTTYEEKGRWYYMDDIGNRQGPYKTEAEAEKHLKGYLEHLESSPRVTEERIQAAWEDHERIRRAEFEGEWISNQMRDSLSNCHKCGVQPVLKKVDPGSIVSYYCCPSCDLRAIAFANSFKKEWNILIRAKMSE